MKAIMSLIIVLLLSGCGRTMAALSLKDTYPKIMRHFRLGEDHSGEWPYGAKKDCIDAIVVNATNNGSLYNVSADFLSLTFGTIKLYQWSMSPCQNTLEARCML